MISLFDPATSVLKPAVENSNEVHSLSYIFQVSVLYLRICFFLQTYDFYSTTFQRQILHFWLHYISMKVAITRYF